MWGQEWGTMIWGQLAALTTAIPISPLALIVLGIGIGISAVKWQSSRSAKLFMLSLAVGFPLIAVMATNLPHQFVNGTVADADEVNANFAALEQQIDVQSSTMKVSVTSNGVSAMRLASIDQARFVSICADEGGCTVRLCYSTFNNPSDDPVSLAACNSERLIAYDESSGKWKAGTYSDTGSSFSTSTDNNGAVSYLATAASCRVSDADIVNPVVASQDISAGLSVLNLHQNAGLTCTATFHD